MSKLSERNLKFETKQLHIGQETQTPTDARAVPIYATTLMYSTIVSTLQTALHSKMQVTSTADLQTRQRMFLKRELQLLRAAQQLLQLHQVQRQFHMHSRLLQKQATTS